ncbi:MAG: HNH endonuclease [Chloroflexi bacterium]|nr:HNH endonuclease [Chloroflexota bacterium]
MAGSQNPNWTREEAVLLLDLYFSAGRQYLSSEHPRIGELSDLLKNLQIHDWASRTETFRNSTGISMMLACFAGIDPMHPWQGFRASKMLKEVWDEFAEDTPRLKHAADQIRRLNALLNSTSSTHASMSDDEEFVEGKLVTKLHTIRERNSSAVKRKKASVLKKTGALECEVCAFNFEETYGDLGKEFAECHHKVPLSEIDSVTTTYLSDLAIVCANCHRMLHRSKPSLSIAKLRNMLDSNDNYGSR